MMSGGSSKCLFSKYSEMWEWCNCLPNSCANLFIVFVFNHITLCN